MKTSKTGLALERSICGSSPAVVLEERAPMSIDCLTMDTPEGMTTSEAGSYYTMATDGTPTTRRHISYAPAAMVEAETAENQQAPVRPDSIQIPNPEFIPDHRWKQLRKWVHCWFALPGFQSNTDTSSTTLKICLKRCVGEWMLETPQLTARCSRRR